MTNSFTCSIFPHMKMPITWVQSDLPHCSSSLNYLSGDGVKTSSHLLTAGFWWWCHWPSRMPYYLYMCTYTFNHAMVYVPGIGHFLCQSSRSVWSPQQLLWSLQRWSIRDFHLFIISAIRGEAAHQYMWLVILLVHPPTTVQSLYLAAFCNFFFSPEYAQKCWHCIQTHNCLFTFSNIPDIISMFYIRITQSHEFVNLLGSVSYQHTNIHWVEI